MSGINGLGLGGIGLGHQEPDRTERFMLQRPLHRVLAFTRRSIDDVVNDPIAKREVLGFYKLHKFVDRRCDTVELERQWNP